VSRRLDSGLGPAELPSPPPPSERHECSRLRRRRQTIAQPLAKRSPGRPPGSLEDRRLQREAGPRARQAPPRCPRFSEPPMHLVADPLRLGTAGEQDKMAGYCPCASCRARRAALRGWRPSPAQGARLASMVSAPFPRQGDSRSFPSRAVAAPSPWSISAAMNTRLARDLRRSPGASSAHGRARKRTFGGKANSPGWNGKAPPT
jgi:hypothetical protein